MVWGAHLSDKCDTRGKSKMLVISDDMFTKRFYEKQKCLQTCGHLRTICADSHVETVILLNV